MNRTGFLLLGALSLSLVFAAQAGAADADAGLQLAQRWCASCHAVEPNPERAPIDGVPSFRSIASLPAYDSGWVGAFIANPHPPMPNLSLSKRDIDDITAYLDRLHADKRS